MPRLPAAPPPPRVPVHEVEFSAVRAQGPGGQNVNKVSTAVQLRFDVMASSLPAGVKARLLATADRRISADGVVVIKSQSARTQERNKAQALSRLEALVAQAAQPPVPRRPTRPTLASKQRRLQAKAQRAQVKAARGKVQD
jgi:ribosome-associated protein